MPVFCVLFGNCPCVVCKIHFVHFSFICLLACCAKFSAVCILDLCEASQTVLQDSHETVFQNLRGAASPPTRRRPASSSWAPATCLWTRRMCGHAVDLPRRIWIPPPPLPLITTARPPGSGLLVPRQQDPPVRAPHHRRLPAFRRQSVYHRCVWFYSVEFNWSILFILYFLYIMEI